MSDPNDRRRPFCSKKNGRTDAVFLYDFAQFSGQSEDTGCYRVKINGKWHCPDGKYTALSADAVAALVRDWLNGKEPPAQRPEGLESPVRVFAHWEDDGDGPGCGTVWTKSPPHLGADGRWWIWVDGPRVRCEDVRKLTRDELRQVNGK